MCHAFYEADITALIADSFFLRISLCTINSYSSGSDLLINTFLLFFPLVHTYFTFLTYILVLGAAGGEIAFGAQGVVKPFTPSGFDKKTIAHNPNFSCFSLPASCFVQQ